LGVLQADGWLVRHRGPGWGWKKTQQKRIEWHEMKMGVYYPLEQAVERQAGRAQLVEKVVVSTLGEAVELGEQLHWEALRRGLARARDLEMLGDGAHWIWHLKQHRWAGAVEVLDFYHGSEHVWALGRALKGEQQAKEWVEPLLQQLRQGQERKVLRQIARLRVPRGERGQRVRKEQSYFAGQEHRMNYQQLAARGWPIGSGAVESASPMPLQKTWPVLDGPWVTQSLCIGTGPPQPPLGGTLEPARIVAVYECTQGQDPLRRRLVCGTRST